jgi:hypothetical protein
MTSTDRKTIGVFASQVGRAWGAEFLAGVMNAAEDANVNLVYFIGGKLMPMPGNGSSKTSFGLYDLAKPGQLDGLLLTSDVAYGVSEVDLKSFRSVYPDLPIVTQSVPIDGATMCYAGGAASHPPDPPRSLRK